MNATPCHPGAALRNLLPIRRPGRVCTLLSASFARNVNTANAMTAPMPAVSHSAIGVCWCRVATLRATYRNFAIGGRSLQNQACRSCAERAWEREDDSSREPLLQVQGIQTTEHAAHIQAENKRQRIADGRVACKETPTLGRPTRD